MYKSSPTDYLKFNKYKKREKIKESNIKCIKVKDGNFLGVSNYRE